MIQVLTRTQAEQDFNAAHIQTHLTVEWTIGVWKRHFRCLHRSAGGPRIKPQSCCTVTAMLHNMAVPGGAALPEEEENEEQEEQEEICVLNPP